MNNLHWWRCSGCGDLVQTDVPLGQALQCGGCGVWMDRMDDSEVLQSRLRRFCVELPVPKRHEFIRLVDDVRSCASTAPITALRNIIMGVFKEFGEDGENFAGPIPVPSTKESERE